MAVNIKAKYKNIPHNVIGPFVATLEHYDSSGFTFNSGNTATLLSTTGVTSSGKVDVLNIGPEYTILKSDLTHQQLVNGFTFYQIKCGDSFITFQSTDVCYTSYVSDLIGANGSPVLKLTVTNDDLDGDDVSSTLTVTSVDDAPTPIPSSITVSTTTSGNDKIILGKGEYNFTFNITTTSPTINKKVELEFIECDTI
jgi:hypothetical protein